MGVACPPVSDDPGYTMVEPSGGRCACQEDQVQVQGCCSPHVFTSVLLGVLSCVLMTGGVFLAFHRWDPMWLMVSGVGVVLILIGTLLHCCNHLSERPSKRRSSAGKGCCPHHPPDHPVLPGGSLTEQLLPLSNARSVSQLSLNMLPGYFPPVVTAYGIEQHSAVVQNISRLVQQQHQGTAGTTSPGFIVLSLPDAASAANIQNLVATVYQLDGSAVEQTSPNGAATVAAARQTSPASLILKNAEVQTCSAWPAAAAPSGARSDLPGPSRSSDDSPAPGPSSSAVSGSTQTDDPVLPETDVNLMDCSDVAPICDNAPCDNMDRRAAQVDIPLPSDVLDTSRTDEGPSTTVLVDIPEPATTILFDVVVTTPPDVRCSEVLVDIVADSDAGGNSTLVDAQSTFMDAQSNLMDAPSNLMDSPSTLMDSPSNLIDAQSNLIDAPAESSVHDGASASDILIDLPDSNLQTADPESSSDTEIEDEGELMGRSSPPPSYEDVTLEGESVGAFGLAYGTI